MIITPTPEQLRIIEYPVRPLRIAAGAGTGKTTTLAMRIAHLVEAGAAEPEQVLGITFTNKAAQELGERIAEMLADTVEPGRDVEIHTYHGFAALILSEFGVLAGVEHEARIITPTFARQLLFDSINAGIYEHLDITWRGIVDRPARLAADLGDNLATASDLVGLTAGQSGKPWDERAELADIVARFEAEKRRLGTLDYADLVRLAHKVVTDHPDVANRIRARYRIVLLDEYQDTNPAQRELLLKIFGDGFPVTAVGDPDQTIYEWRGASLENFAAFPRHFSGANSRPAETYSLTINRRSARAIIEFANSVRSRTGGDVGADLEAADTAGAGLVATRWTRTAVDEAEFIADTMLELREDGYEWRQMAALFRKNKDITLVQQALEERNVPTEVASIGGLLAIPEIVDLHAWLRILNDPADSPALLRILLGSRYRLGFADVLPLSRWTRAGDDHEDALTPSLLEAIDVLDNIDVLDDIDGLAQPARRALTAFRSEYRNLLQDAQGSSLVELARRILQVTGSWQEVEAMPDHSRLSVRLNLHRFLDLAEEWSPLEGRPSLPAFLDYLDEMVEGNGDELTPARLSGQDAVALLTVHRAKGLEWPIVFIPATYKSNFPSGVRSYEDPFEKAHVLPHELRLDRDTLPSLSASMDITARRAVLKEQSDRQEWRTAYVAATRAKERLYLSGAHWYGSPEPRKQAVKPGELFELATSCAEDLGNDEAGDRPELLRYEPVGDGAPDPVFPDGWDAALRAMREDRGWAERRATQLGVAGAYHERVDHYQDKLFRIPETPPPVGPEPLLTSVTGLVTYAICPQRFYWSEVDRLPRRPSSAARRGVEIHRRIELHNRGEVPLDDFTEDAYDIGPSDAGSAGTRPFEAFLESRFAATAPLLIEAPFDLRVGSSTIRGRIDAVYAPEAGHWEIVDFKSGAPSKLAATAVQLEAYALAATEVPFTLQRPSTIDVTFAYLGGGLQTVSERADEEWIHNARDHVTTLLDNITDEVWDASPSSACRHCDFARFCDAGTLWLKDHQ
ncbi:MAG: ATP-dependent DNA helicase [Acidimicrobiia bacterium]|nr:ATP-dependent DNA helicase [Acidimicrobiia bacterium]